MKCAICRGACCEHLTVGLDMQALVPDARRWVQLHAVGFTGTQVTFDARCRELTPTGRCQIYDDRPELCAAFTAGGPECLTTVRIRRTPAEYQTIREDHDPMVLTR